jgi:single-stranded-DNA-specific exonuclease
MNRPDVPELLVQILAGRGLSKAEIAKFLYPDYDAGAYDPGLLTDMTAAVDRIVLAGERGERVVVYGDYDIDGITASAVMIEGLAALGINATSYIPDRFEEGYGINLAALEHLKAEGADLVISVDCGITSVGEAAWAREHGLDLIITDHHAVPAEIPGAIAVINPKRPGDAYPFKDLAGVGVAFKVIQALQRRTGSPAPGQEKWLLDLVAMGTICDVVTLVDENRTLASFGLKVLRQTRRVGLRELAAVAGVEVSKISAYHVGYVLGPRMNAAGRLEHASQSLELVMTTDRTRAREIAAELDALNRQRRADQDAIFAMADEMAAAYADDPVLVLAHPEWSHGVVGIVASKLVEKWQKPTLVAQILTQEAGADGIVYAKGSARSVGNFNMVEALRAHEPLFTKFGGHFFAAGYTLPVDRIEHLRTGLNEHFVAMGASNAPIEVRTADVTLADLRDVNEAALELLELLEPFGSGNPRPLWALGGLTVEQVATMGRDKTHLRVKLRDDAGQRVMAVGFGLAEQYVGVQSGQRVTVLGELNKNEFQGKSTLQVVMKEMRYE